MSSLTQAGPGAGTRAPRRSRLVGRPLALTFMAFLDVLQGLGVGEALIVADAAELEREAETAFALSTAIGLVLWGLSGHAVGRS